ncbi:MAG: HU family DNA-binding protein, partial [Muribaculaceae bacterium]|nr:HU family DNA-binding protein [Muribaculaceae bacterium]
MNESINLPKLIAKLAAEAGCDPAEARRFLHHLFSLVEESLLAGETVSIKGVGEFHPGEDPADPIKFRPDDTLAAVANEPFAAFSPTELNDGVTAEMLGEQPAPVEAEPQMSPVPEPVSAVSEPVEEEIVAQPEEQVATPQEEPQQPEQSEE